jgi:hypothetical protein
MTKELLPPSRRQSSDIRRFGDKEPLRHTDKNGYEPPVHMPKGRKEPRTI